MDSHNDLFQLEMKEKVILMLLLLYMVVAACISKKSTWTYEWASKNKSGGRKEKFSCGLKAF